MFQGINLTLKKTCLLTWLVGMTFFGHVLADKLKYDSAQYAIFLDLHNVHGFPIQNIERIDSLMKIHRASNDSIQLFFGYLSYAFTATESSVKHTVDQLVKASDIIEANGNIELSPFLNLAEGQIYSILKRYDEAKKLFIDAAVAFKDDDDGMYLISNAYIANMLNRLDEPEESILTLDQTSELLKSIENQNSWLFQMLLLKDIRSRNASYIMTGQLDHAEKSLKRTIELSTQLDQGNVLQNAKGNISFVYLQKGEFDNVLKYALSDLDYSLKTNREQSINGLAGVIAQTHMKLGALDSANKYIDLLLMYENKFHNWAVLQNNLNTLLQYYRSQNQIDSAFNVLNRYLYMIDSIVSSRKSQDYELIQSELKLKNAAQKIETLTLLNQLKAQSIENKNQVNVILILFTVSLMVFLFLAYRSIKSIRGKNTLLEEQQVQIHTQNEEIKGQRDQLEIKNKSLVQLNKDKNDLIAIVAHDLRSPLNQIRGLIGVIKMEGENLNSEQGEFLDIMDNSSRRLSDMIGQILSVNAIESNQIDLKMDKIDIGEVLELLSVNFKVLADKKNITIHLKPLIEKKMVLADQNYLIQVLENLVSNAIKFSFTNGHIHLKCESEHGTNRIIVSDEGPGISQEDQLKLFQKYQKLSASPTGGEESTGLGLSIAKKYIEAMDGKIECQSELGKGTSFIIMLK